MNRIVWLLATSYVALGTALFYGLAIGSPTVSLVAAAVFVVLAGPQWLLLSRTGDRVRTPGRTPRNRT